MNCFCVFRYDSTAKMFPPNYSKFRFRIRNETSTSLNALDAFSLIYAKLKSSVNILCRSSRELMICSLLAFFSLFSHAMAANKERTFIMVKPDGVQRGLVGKIIKRFEAKGFKLVALKFTWVSNQIGLN